MVRTARRAGRTLNLPKGGLTPLRLVEGWSAELEGGRARAWDAALAVPLRVDRPHPHHVVAAGEADPTPQAPARPAVCVEPPEDARLDEPAPAAARPLAEFAAPAQEAAAAMRFPRHAHLDADDAPAHALPAAAVDDQGRARDGEPPALRPQPPLGDARARNAPLAHLGRRAHVSGVHVVG